MMSVRCANRQTLQRRVHDLQAENERFRCQLDAALRAGKRQGAPFAKAPRRVAELLWVGLKLRDRHAAGKISRHGLAVARGRLERQLSELVFPPKTNAANERLAQHLRSQGGDLFTFLRQPGLDATN